MECVLCQTTRCCPEHCCAWGDCECGDCDQCGGDQPWKISSDDEFVTIENESQPLQEVTPGSDEPLSDGGDPSCSAAPPHTKARTCDKVKKACRGAHLLSHDSSHSAVAASLDKWREGWEERERKTARLEQEEEDRLRRLQKAAQCKQDSSRHFPTLIHSLCEQVRRKKSETNTYVQCCTWRV